ncbi:MAG: hypothetical protein QNK26_09835 [Moritella sp.]|uniref:hypothetical protein n=1 Tax=Moritella sp. TaxID=78556 RepID=UPI0029A71029|nr:hypothetical protein [Moritella sp.]MDX2320878.1 hypothetical protein [Moritella sp.]
MYQKKTKWFNLLVVWLTLIAACLTSITVNAASPRDKQAANFNTPIEAWHDIAYITPAANQHSVLFTLPNDVSVNDIAQVNYADAALATSLWHVDGESISFSPIDKWSMGMNLIELQLNNGQIFDYFIVIYGGKFALTAKSQEYQQRLAQFSQFKQLISAGYTADANASVHISKADFTDKQLQQVRVNGNVVNNASIQERVFSYTPSSAWSEGLNQIEIQLQGDELPHTHLLSYHPQVTEVIYSMDESSVDGQAFFPQAVYYVKPTSFAKVADFGFNVVHDYKLRRLPEPQITDYLQQADAHGLMVFSHINEKSIDNGDVIAFATRIATQMAEPALFAWYFWDEPSPNDIPAEYYNFFVELARQLDPFHPIISSHWYQRYYAEAGEVDMRQFYHGKASEMAKALALYKRVMAQTDTPWVAILNTHEGFKAKDSISISPRHNVLKIINKAKSPEQKTRLQEWLDARYKVIMANLDNPPLPVPASLPQSREQIRGQAFEAIAQGSNGLFFWPYREPDDLDPVTGWYTLFHMPKPASYMRELMHDLATLGPLIAAPRQNSTSWVVDGIRFWQRELAGNIIIIAVNESGKSQHAKVQIKPFSHGQWPNSLVRFSHAQQAEIALENGYLADNWKAEQAHVYLLKNIKT